MTTSRQHWLRDERILVVDLYVQRGPNVPVAAVREMSDLLRAIPIEIERASDPAFRSVNSVGTKLANFQWLDPRVPGGLAHVSDDDIAVWAEYEGKEELLRADAQRIRAALASPELADDEEDDPDFMEAVEGAILTRLHRVRERNRALVARKKSNVLRDAGLLRCECCGFDYSEVYGSLGDGFIECHHRRPVSELEPGQPTTLLDLALVCANCHRMIHKQRPWLSVDDLRSRLQSIGAPP